LSLAASTFLYIEGMKIGTEMRLEWLTVPPTLGVLAAFLAWTWARHRRYQALLALLPEPAPSRLIAEAAMNATHGKKSESPKRESKNRAPRSPEKAHSAIDDVWASFSQDIRSRSKREVLNKKQQPA
jgi:hypothetical protein